MANSKAAKAKKNKKRRAKAKEKKLGLIAHTTSTNTVTQPVPQTLIKAAIACLSADHCYNYGGVEIEVEDHYSCRNSSNYYSDSDDDYYNTNAGRCDGICRCRRIESAYVKEVDIPYITKFLCGREPANKNELIEQYCIDRILRINNLYSSDSWYVRFSGGYYGDEIDSVKIGDSTKSDIITNLHGVANHRTNSEKIKKVLEYEYGYILPALIPLSEAYIEEVNTEDLVFGNLGYAKKIPKDDIEIYDDYELPRAICTTEKGTKPGASKYRVMDGYHRVLSAKNRGDKLIKIIILDH